MRKVPMHSRWFSDIYLLLRCWTTSPMLDGFSDFFCCFSYCLLFLRFSTTFPIFKRRGTLVLLHFPSLWPMNVVFLAPLNPRATCVARAKAGRAESRRMPRHPAPRAARHLSLLVVAIRSIRRASCAREGRTPTVVPSLFDGARSNRRRCRTAGDTLVLPRTVALLCTRCPTRFAKLRERERERVFHTPGPYARRTKGW